MKPFFFLCAAFLLCLGAAHAQSNAYDHIYDPTANAAEDLKKACAEASAAHKHVLVQVGGNWCIWCKRFYKLTTEDTALSREVNANYVVYHLNYSKEQKNLPLLAQFGYPQRFGFPVLLVLDAQGNRLHTQNTSLLEEANGYDPKKVMEMLREWSPAALNPKNYANE
ncbi:MAG TPA: thioredoxin family protein [Chitinophaga sp.]